MLHNELFDLIKNEPTKFFQDLSKAHANPTKFQKFHLTHATIFAAIKELYPELPFQEATYLAREGKQFAPTCAGCELPAAFKTAPTKHYSKFCSEECRRSSANHNDERLIIDGAEYRNFVIASETIGMARSVIRQRVLSPKWSTWRYAENHDTKCFDRVKSIGPLFETPDFLINWKNSGNTQSDLAESVGKNIETIRQALHYYGII